MNNQRLVPHWPSRPCLDTVNQNKTSVRGKESNDYNRWKDLVPQFLLPVFPFHFPPGRVEPSRPLPHNFPGTAGRLFAQRFALRSPPALWSY